MMRKIILISVFMLGVLISGIFTVDDRQSAVVTNRLNKQTEVYTTGLHFAWPLLTRVNYIFINQRASAFNFKLTILDNTPVALTSIVLWKVTKPVIFLQNSISMTQAELTHAISEKIEQIVVKQTKSLNLMDLNQHSLLLDQAVSIDSLGVKLDSITINEITTAAHTAGIATESGVSLVEKVESSPVDFNILSIESAYYQAQTIKTQAEIEQAKMYSEIQAKSPQFYDYFRKLQIYKNSAKSKQEMPPLQDLYSN